MKVTTLNRILSVIFVTLLIAAVILFAILFQYDRSVKRDGKLYSIEIEGEYSEEGGSWQPLTRKTFFENWDLRNIMVRGHFTRTIPSGTKLFMNIDHMWITLRINGEELYSIGSEDGDGNPTQAMGKQWVTIESPGIETDDVIELNFGNLYCNAYMIQFDELLWQMHTGDERMMLFQAVRLDAWTIAVGTIFLFLTLFLLAVFIGCAAMHIKGARRFLWLGLTTLFSAFWFYTLSPAPTMIVPLPVFLNVLYAFSMQAMATSIVLFASEHLTSWRKRCMLFSAGILMLLLLVAILNQIFSIQDLYSAINYFSIIDLIIALWMMFCLVYETYKLKSRESAELMKAMAPVVFFSVVELVNGFLQFSKASILLGAGLITFAVMEEVYILRRIKQSIESEKRALILENELNESRISIMLSQIQPHFLYNSLLGIKQLCDTEPKKASDALEHFSFYLRGNLDSIGNTRLIPFVKELEHLRDYLYLEKMRFSKKLNIIYEIEYQNFMLPPLTVQPIVENAVRYGIIKKKGGGTLTIRSERIDNLVVITITDDGIGFDPSELKKDDRSHIGIVNVDNRLQLLCGGNLIIESKKKVGTTAKILLPQKEGILCGSLQ